MHLKNLTKYLPKNPRYGNRVQYLIDEEGKDFYESLPLFVLDWIVIYDSFGVVRGLTEKGKIDRFFPLGMSVLEVAEKPPLSLDGKDILIDGEFKRSVVDFAVPTSKSKKIRLDKIKSKISDLVMQGEENLTKAEIFKLVSLRASLKATLEIDEACHSSDVAWPEIPGE